MTGKIGSTIIMFLDFSARRDRFPEHHGSGLRPMGLVASRFLATLCIGNGITQVMLIFIWELSLGA